jgi:hypothetical protein
MYTRVMWNIPCGRAASISLEVAAATRPMPTATIEVTPLLRSFVERSSQLYPFSHLEGVIVYFLLQRGHCETDSVAAAVAMVQETWFLEAVRAPRSFSSPVTVIRPCWYD